MCIFGAAAMKGGAMCMFIVIAELKAVRWRTLVAAGEGEGGEPHNSLDKHRPDKPMKPSSQLTRFTSLLTPALLAGAWIILSADLYAAEQNEAEQKPMVAPRLFASPEEAVKALQAAAETKDHAAMREVFGSEFDQLVTGDKVQDADNAQQFAAVLAQGCQPVKEGDDRIILEIGTNNHPMAIPLVKVDGQWHFDTAAGRERGGRQNHS